MSIHLIGISVPRSGHHYLERLLRVLLAESGYRYCEFYVPKNCCRSVPCKHLSEHAIFFQKNHDFRQSAPTDLADATYLIQYRDPVAAALSERELIERVKGAEFAADISRRDTWLARKTVYFRMFFERWVRESRPNRIVIDYDRLKRDTADVLTQIFSAIGISRRAPRIQKTIAACSGTRGFGDAYKSRRLSDSKYYDEKVYTVFESIVLDYVPELEDKRRLETVDFENSHIYAMSRMFEALQANNPLDSIFFGEKALSLCGENHELSFILAKAYKGQRDNQRARKLIDQSLKARPNESEYIEFAATLPS